MNVRKILGLSVCFMIPCLALAEDNTPIDGPGIPPEEYENPPVIPEVPIQTQPNYGFGEIYNLVFRESVGVAGTPYALHYTSWRVPGNQMPYTLNIPLFKSPAADALEEIHLAISVAGVTNTVNWSKPFSANMHSFLWNGKDGSSNTVEGCRTAQLDFEFKYIIYTYSSPSESLPTTSVDNPFSGNEDPTPPLVPLDSGNWPVAGEVELPPELHIPPNGREDDPPAISQTADAGASVSVAQPYTYQMNQQTQLGVILAEKQGLAGWTLTPHHIYDPVGGMLYRGDGGFGSAEAIRTPACVFTGYNDQTNEITQLEIVSKDASELYVFTTNGVHLYTRDTISGATNILFGYDASNLLVTITDVNGDVTTIERDVSGVPEAIVGPYGQRTELFLDSNGYLAGVVNPVGGTNRFEYTGGGLLTNVISRRGNAFPITYDSSGRLIRAADPVGGYDELSKTKDYDYYEIENRQSLGRTNLFRVVSLPGSYQQRINTFADGSVFESIESSDETIQSNRYPDGTSIIVNRGPDPRFGMQVPRAEEISIQMPSELSMAASMEQTAALSDTNDLLSIIALTNNLTINGKIYQMVYTASNRQAILETPEGRVYKADYDVAGRLVKIDMPGMTSISGSYDEHGRLQTVLWGPAALERSVRLSYAANGYLQAITNNDVWVYGFSSDAIGQVTNIMRPDGEEVGLDYDPSSHITGVTPPGKTKHTFSYTAAGLISGYGMPDVGSDTNMTITWNAARQVTSLTRPGDVITNEYNNGGQLTAMQWPHNRIEITWEPSNGVVDAISSTNGYLLDFGSDGPLLTNVVAAGPVSGSVSYAYNTDFMLSSVRVNGGDSIGYLYDDDGLLTGAGELSLHRDAASGFLTNMSLNNLSGVLGYNVFGELSHYEENVLSTNLFCQDYSHDKMGKITNKVEVVLGVTNAYDYVYDDAGRLAEVRTNGSVYSSYQYDANGNRTNAVVAGGASTGTYDAQDRMISYGSATCQYSPAGTLTNKSIGGQATAYQYDALGNLLSVSSSAAFVEYLIDPLGRRVGKKLNGILVSGFLYQDMLNPIAELDADNNIVSEFIYGSRPNVPDYMVKSGTTYRIISDHLGSVRMVIDAQTGAIIQQVDYDEFGRVLNDTNPGFQPFGFAGGIYDADTGFVRFGYRDYDAETGRWTAKDPILFAGGQANLYLYCHGDPVNYYDPLGLFDYSAAQTQMILRDAVRGYKTSSWGGALLDARKNHGYQGKYDYKVNSPSDTFIVDGQTLAADQFGNYIAGYATYGRFGQFGTAMTKAAGDWYEFWAFGNEYWLDDPGSTEMINKGVHDFFNDYRYWNDMLYPDDVWQDVYDRTLSEGDCK